MIKMPNKDHVQKEELCIKIEVLGKLVTLKKLMTKLLSV